MAIKLAKAMGAEVVVLSRSLAKADEAKALGAEIMVHSEPDVMKANALTFDVILATAAVSHHAADIIKDAGAHFTSVAAGETGTIRAVIDISTIKDL